MRLDEICSLVTLKEMKRALRQYISDAGCVLADRRRRLPLRWLPTICMLAALGAAGRQPSSIAPAEALAEYVNRPDQTFRWKLVEQRDAGPLKAARFECTSQTWREIRWQHEMLLVWPAQRRNTDIAFLLITGDGKVERQFEFL